MRKTYLLLAGLLTASLGIISTPVVAQYEFTDNNLSPYRQNFNTLSGAVTMNGNQVVSIPELYAQANLGTETAPFSFNPPSIGANDGNNRTAYYYHFGYVGDADRSFGGVASFETTGNGYVGIRLKNSSNKEIKNLEVEYAMEQWYNSGRQDQASVEVSYKRGTTVTSLIGPTGTAATDWQAVTALDVPAPSTTTALLGRDGNADSNRRVRQTTIVGLNLQPNEEIMIRWKYALNNNTNGNGLSIDDVVITPQTNIFYSALTGNLDDTATWGIYPDGTGGGVEKFTIDNAIYYVQGPETDRIGSGTWTVSGANSKIIVGRPGANANLLIAPTKNISGRIDVASGSRLAINRTSSPISFSLGSLGLTSTVAYISSSTIHNIQPAAYGNLNLGGAGGKVLTSNIIINTGLTLADNAKLTLGDYSATIIRNGALTVSANTFVITNGKGSLRRSVLNSGVDVLFPVGTSASSYTPVFLRQPNNTAARNEDVFSVRVIDGMYSRYDAAENGTGAAVTNQNVKKTWLISEEVTGGSDVTMGLQWNTADEMTGGATGTNFDRNKAYVAHYLTNSTRPYFDQGVISVATAGTANNSYKVTRSGITSFSPFSVSSRAAAPLPVQLVAFTANPMGSAVQCAWQTATELNNARFVVERSATGQHFTAIGTVAGKGTTSTGQQYQFTDATPLTGLNYYRLRQIDTDGTETLSAVAVVNIGKAAVAQVTPNPGTQSFRVLLPAETVILGAKVFNILGAQVAVVSLDGSFTLDRQPAGVYIVQVSTAQGTQSLRIIKE